MHPKLAGNPLIAWRGPACLQVGWGDANLRVDEAPRRLPEWLRMIDGSRTTEQLVRSAGSLEIEAAQALEVLDALASAGLLKTADDRSVSLAPCGLLADPLAAALRAAGLAVVPEASVLVFPQGQLPSLASVPDVQRLVPVWFGTRAVHVGPVVDRGWGPCPECVERRWGVNDPDWPALVAQAGHIGAPAGAAQLALAAAGVLMQISSDSASGLELILDLAGAGPRWRVWLPEQGCSCRPDMTMAGLRSETRHR